MLGILLVNIQSFSMPEAVSANPFLLGSPSGLEYVIWLITYLFACQKFMTIFSMLFGAGILLMSDRLTARTHHVNLIMYRRFSFLVLIGLIHAYFIWSGDVLVAYGLCGMVVVAGRKFSPRTLVILGTLLLSIATLNLIGLRSWALEQEFLSHFSAWLPSTTQPAAEIAAYRGAWISQNAARFVQAVAAETYSFAVFTFWRVTGLMLLGMALFRWKLFHGEWPKRLYAAMVGFGFIAGVPLTFWGLSFYRTWGWNSLDAALIAQACNSVASIPLSFAWVGVALLCWRFNLIQGTVCLLANVGRMALTNYICQSLICTTIFYGFGFDMFGKVGRLTQVGYVLGIWAFQLFVSSLWLKHFQFGPLEWLWRSLTYAHLQPLRRSASA